MLFEYELDRLAVPIYPSVNQIVLKRDILMVRRQ
jgi:hypothetical protein